ncbi:hypothetical protein Hdeb2414_s0011g00362761 [Helianthus debilis subsp. tardiflorus]
MLVDESEKEAEAEGDQVHLSPESAKLLKALTKDLEEDKTAGDNEGDDAYKSSLSSSEEEIDENERAKRIQAKIEKEKQLKRKRREDKDDELYNPSPEHVFESQTPTSSGGRKKASARKHVVTPKVAKRLRVLRRSKPIHEPKNHIHHQNNLHHHHHLHHKLNINHHQFNHHHINHHHINHHQNIKHHHINHQFKNNLLLLHSKSLQPHVQTTPCSSGFKYFPQIPANIPLDDIGDFNFANDEQVKRLEKKVEEVLVENKKMLDRENKLEKRVKTVRIRSS